jgi:hypothetical protein
MMAIVQLKSILLVGPLIDIASNGIIIHDSVRSIFPAHRCGRTLIPHSFCKDCAVNTILTIAAFEVQGGKVIWHSKDRDEVYRKAVELRPKHFATLYLGKMPENTAIVL